MSFSFSVEDTTAEAVMEKVGQQLDEVVAQQPIHAIDHDAALDATASVIAILPEPAEGEEYRASVNGSVSYTSHEDTSTIVTGVSLGVSVLIAKK
jgi:hypothetical protein